MKQIDSNQKRIKKTRTAKGFLENRSRDFWSEISIIRRKTHITPCTVEGFSNNEDISSCFSCYYKDLYNSVSFDSIEWSNLYKTINNKICNECINHTVNVNDVENAINKLKPGKSDGFDGITSDYLINASPLCFVFLSYLFTTMLYYCFTPKSLCNSTMIPKPKGSNKDTYDIKNYRGIALSSLLSKVFDSCIMSLNSMVLRSDDLQFAYKKSCSTIQCVSMVTEVINYYRHNGSSVYMCILDASKAFDRVNLLTLFKTLYSMGMCPIYLRLLMKIYEEQNMRIRWNNTIADYFTISNGVKQGGVLSQILFSLYMDQLISRLRHIGMGCNMNGLFTGVFIYADDITLLAPSRASLALVLEQCESFSRTFCSTLQKQNIWFSSVVR